VRKDGSVWCWGENGFSQLGYFSVERANPKAHSVGSLGGPATQVSAGILHTCARLRDGTARCWGANAKGQLGTGKAAEVPATGPVAVAGLSGIAEIAAGSFFTCARLDDGTVRCWGANESGQLGDGTTQDRLSPVQVEGVAGAVEIAAGNAFACARLAGGEVACWGNDRKGSKASRVAGVEGAVQVVANGEGWACARLRTGAGLCWSPASGPSAELLPAAEGALSDLALGSGHACVIDARGTLRCKGTNQHGQLCDGSSPPRSSSFPPPPG
jgi:alpha-tubulin suppressor-like RCC1 family protein